MDKKALTPRQEEVYQFILQRTRESKLPPTVREIGETFQITSTNGVRSILSALIKKGYIRRSPRLSRAIEIVAPPASEMNSSHAKTMEIPIVGRVAAGQPILAVQNLEGTVTVDQDFLSRQSNVFALRVKGDSMTGAGIFDGDLIFARQQPTAEDGQIIVALVDDEATVKYYKPRGNTVELHSANPLYAPIIISADRSFSIAGRVIGIMRRIH